MVDWLQIGQTSGHGDTQILVKAKYSSFDRSTNLVLSGVTKSIVIPVEQTGMFGHDYFYIYVSSGGYVKFKSNGTTKYKKNYNSNWEDVPNTQIQVEAGDTVWFKGTGNYSGRFDSGSTTATFSAGGNVMSLIYGDSYENKYDLPEPSGVTPVFGGLFDECSGLTDSSSLWLPATGLTDGCYFRMFYGCDNMTGAPSILPATTLADRCYSNMFEECTSLQNIPYLPATDIPTCAYCDMFRACMSLCNLPETLPMTNIGVSGCSDMFGHCTSITETPIINISSVDDSSCDGMFFACLSLETCNVSITAPTTSYRSFISMFSWCESLKNTPPSLPAMNMGEDCYEGMFAGCSSLTTTMSILPATALTVGCYASMFVGCKSLTRAPELPATGLTGDCYKTMFSGCTNLNYIKCLAVNNPYTLLNTYQWVKGVSANGTFVKPTSMQYWSTGESGIPSGWTVQNV